MGGVTRHADLDLTAAGPAGKRVDGGELKVINAALTVVVSLGAQLREAASDNVCVRTRRSLVNRLILINSGYLDVVDA